MQRYTSLDEIHLQNTWLSIGSFDGVHRGHQEILSRLSTAARSQGALPAALTFFPHPAEVLLGQKGPFYLTSPDEKAALIEAQGVDILITLTFTKQLAQIPAADFMTHLKRQLGLKQLWVGYNFTLGRNREGDIPTLRRLGELLDYHLEVVTPISLDGAILSSSQIRGFLNEGAVEKAAQFLGRLYDVEGEVVAGDGRGRTIGIPTANLSIWEGRMLPENGVYATWAWVDGQRKEGVVNIGSRPTFETQATPPRLEIHLLDFDGDLYGKRIRVEFIRRLRDEQRFSSVQALVQQIHEDIQAARGLFTHEP